MKKKHSVALILFGVLLAVTVLLCGAVFFLWQSGRSAMTQVVEAPQLPPKTTEAETPVEFAPVDPYTVVRDGKTYTYNRDLCNLLLIGIDADKKPDAPLPRGSDIQADVLVLASLDLRNKQIRLIGLNRDTMCHMTVPDDQGNPTGTAYGQLALAYSCGDGLEESCRLTVDAVSSLFYGLQIHGYGAFFMGGVADLNDALGGVTLTVRGDYPFPHMYGEFSQMVDGAEVTLTGPMASAYIRCRLDSEEGNLLRMQRQKQYMMALAQKGLANLKENPSAVFDYYQAVKDYILTDLTMSQMSFLATQMAGMEFAGTLVQPVGILELGQQNHMEMVLNEDALYDLILDVFYEEQ